MVDKIITEYFWVYLAKIVNLYFANYTQNSANISATVLLPEAILYSKQIGGYSISPYSFYMSQNIKAKDGIFWKIEKKTQLRANGEHPF